MSVETDSWSSDDGFAALLDAELDLSGSDDDIIDDNSRCKRRKKNSSCPHPGFLKDMCILCGERTTTGDLGGVAFRYIHKDLLLKTDEISRLRNSDVRSVLSQKKLYLILDLDHTLLNSTRIDQMTCSEQEYLHSRIDTSKGGSLFRLDIMRMMTKLRPFVRTFLQEASHMFEMSIYTMGERAYALEMAKLLDPENVYFNSRVISKDDCTQTDQKGLDVVLGQENAVLILDDTEAVWQKHKENLILMDRYNFFSSSCRQFRHHYKKSLSELKSDGNEHDGTLATILGVLKRIHAQFFDNPVATRDVRQVRREIRKEVLKGCSIVFSRIIPNDFAAPSEHPMWRMAEQMGATCSMDLGASVTHVVSPYPGTDKARWAVRKGKFLVHPRWLEAASYLWQRQPEDKFPVISKKSC